MKTDLGLQNKVVAIAGATGGVGGAIAQLLASEGCTIAAGYFSSPQKGENLVGNLEGAGHTTHKVVLEKSSSLETFANEVLEVHSRVDVVVNAAGMTMPVSHADLEGLRDEIIDQVFANNWRGPFALVRAFAPLLREAEDGVFINISSISAFTTNGSSVAYCGSKAALDSMTRTLGKALAPDIRVLGISPGVVETDFVEGRDAEFYSKVAQTIPLKRVGQPEDVAKAVLAAVALLTFSTGTIITTDGGRSL